MVSPAASEYQRTVQPSAAVAVNVVCSGPQFDILSNVGSFGLGFTVIATETRSLSQPDVLL